MVSEAHNVWSMEEKLQYTTISSMCIVLQLKCSKSIICVTAFLPGLLRLGTMFELGLAVRGEGGGNSAVAFTK